MVWGLAHPSSFQNSPPPTPQHGKLKVGGWGGRGCGAETLGPKRGSVCKRTFTTCEQAGSSAFAAKIKMDLYSLTKFSH